MQRVPRGQWLAAQKRRIVEVTLRAGSLKTFITAKRRLSEGRLGALWWEFGHRAVAGDRIKFRGLQIPGK